MKRILLTAVGGLACIITASTHAQTSNNQIQEELYKIDPPTQENLEFQTFSSCDDMTSTLESYIKDNFNNLKQSIQRRFIDDCPECDQLFFAEAEMAGASDGAPVPTTPVIMNKQASGSMAYDEDIGFSETNIQIGGVDEADILKSDGSHIYYYNTKEQKIHILKSPLDQDEKTLDLDEFELISNITIPQSMTNNVKLFLEDEKLAIIAGRYRSSQTSSLLNNNQKTDIIIYDVSNPKKPSLLKFTELDGYYHDARMIGDQITIITQVNINRYQSYQQRASVDDVSLEQDDLLPHNIDIAYTTNPEKQNLQIGNDSFPYSWNINSTDCQNIHYTLPSKSSIQKGILEPNFTIISTIELDELDEAPGTTTAYGNTQAIHMSTETLYLTSNIRTPAEYTCPANARCIRPGRGGTQQTLIHKFEREGSFFDYEDSALIPGSPLTQYSMSEDKDGYFRILTNQRSPEQATHFFILDKNLELTGSVKNIEPGEEFKSSRYIGDKLYLVTFERTDPLFVIDTVDTNNPRIIGELKIPGYSSYLHPYGPLVDGKQYILGLGTDTAENQRGGIQNTGVKLDLYEIDYTSEDEKGYIGTKQLYSTVRGDEGSYTEAQNNPRTFVRDSKRKLLLLPLHIKEKDGGQECSITYDKDGNEISKNCRDTSQSQTTFWGTKGISVDIESGISETSSHDFMNVIKQDRESRNNGYINNRLLQPRVGYIGDATFMVNGLFASTTLEGIDDSYTTEWLNNDSLSATGDREHYDDTDAYPNVRKSSDICLPGYAPNSAVLITAEGEKTPEEAGQAHLITDHTGKEQLGGAYCENSDEETCLDYKIRYTCETENVTKVIFLEK